MSIAGWLELAHHMIEDHDWPPDRVDALDADTVRKLHGADHGDARMSGGATLYKGTLGHTH